MVRRDDRQRSSDSVEWACRSASSHRRVSYAYSRIEAGTRSLRQGASPVAPSWGPPEYSRRLPTSRVDARELRLADRRCLAPQHSQIGVDRPHVLEDALAAGDAVNAPAPESPRPRAFDARTRASLMRLEPRSRSTAEPRRTARRLRDLGHSYALSGTPSARCAVRGVPERDPSSDARHAAHVPTRRCSATIERAGDSHAPSRSSRTHSSVEGARNDPYCASPHWSLGASPNGGEAGQALHTRGAIACRGDRRHDHSRAAHLSAPGS